MKSIGRYILEDKIAEGGFSTVYRCHDPDLNTTVAIKVFGIGQTESTPDRTEHWKHHFDAEARLLSDINHPHIISVTEVGYDEEAAAPFFVMPFMPSTLVNIIGEDISDPDHIDALAIERRPKSINEENAIPLLKQILFALVALHEQGFVHRDIKPENILLTAPTGGAIKLCDFGIMAELGSEQAGECVGSLDYQCPEQRDKGVKVDVRADIYSVGALAYRMLTGEVTEGFTPPPEEINPDLNPDLCGLIVSAMDVDRTRRPKNAAAMLAELNRLFPSP